MLSKKVFLVTTLLLIVSVSHLLAQTDRCTLTLSGQVIDEHDQQPLSFSTIYLSELGRGAVSDSNGYFTIKNLCSQKYTIIIGHIGCEPDTQLIVLKKNTKKTFYLEHHVEELGEFAVVEKNESPMETVVKRNLSTEELNLSRGKSLGESLKQLPGVTSLNTGNNVSKPIIHGMHSDRIVILNNGVRQEGQQWGSEHAPEIDPFIANHLSVIKGAEGIRYGANAIGGVILVEPKALRDSAGLDGEFHLVGASNGQQGTTSATLNGNSAKLNGLSWRLQGTLKQAGNLRTPNYYMKNTGMKEYNFSWGLGYNKKKFGVELFYSQFNSDIGIFSAAHIGNLTDLQLAFESEQPLESAGFTYVIDRPFQHIEHELFKVKGYWWAGDVGKLQFSYARQYNLRSEYDKHQSRNSTKVLSNDPDLEFEITTHTADLVWEQNRKKQWRGVVGVSGIYQANTTSGRNFIPNFIKYNSGVFLIENWLSKNYRWKLETGIRYDYIYQQVYQWVGNELTTPEFAFHNVSGSFGAIYKFTEYFNVNANVGSAFRPPNVSELFSNGLHHGAAAVEFGDINLVSEKALNSILALEYMKDKLKIQVEGYYNRISNFIYLAPILPPTLTIRGAFPTFQYQQVNATFKGVDAKVDYRFHKNFNYVFKASVLRAYNEDENEWLFGMPADRMENGLRYYTKNSGKIQEFYIGTSVQHVFKQTRYEANTDFVSPPAGYELANLQVGLDIPYTSKKHVITIGMEINNVFNTVYRDYLNRFRYFTDETGRNYSIKLKTTF